MKEQTHPFDIFVVSLFLCCERFRHWRFHRHGDGQGSRAVNEDMVDMCMEDLDRFNGSIMENETVEYIVADTVREHKGANNE